MAYLEIDDKPNCSDGFNVSFNLSSKTVIFYCLNDKNYYDYNKKNISDKSLISYGEIIFIKYEILSYYILFVGFFITFYGPNHYVFGIFTHISLFLYFLIKDLVELNGKFNEYIPLYLITFSFVNGLAFVIYNYFSESDKKLKNKIIKTLYGCILGYFLFKTIFYNIVIFIKVNPIVYAIFLVILKGLYIFDLLFCSGLL